MMEKTGPMQGRMNIFTLFRSRHGPGSIVVGFDVVSVGIDIVVYSVERKKEESIEDIVLVLVVVLVEGWVLVSVVALLEG